MCFLVKWIGLCDVATVTLQCRNLPLLSEVRLLLFGNHYIKYNFKCQSKPYPTPHLQKKSYCAPTSTSISLDKHIACFSDLIYLFPVIYAQSKG